MAKPSDEKPKKLTPKQEMFCQEYLIDLNATQAAKRAGYSEKTAKDIAGQNLSKLIIRERIEQLKAARVDSVGVDAAYVLKRLVAIDELDLIDIINDDGSLKALTEWPKSWRTYLSGFDLSEMSGADGNVNVLKKIKWPDKVKNLELIGKHVNIQAWSDKVVTETTLKVSEPLHERLTGASKR